jgi:hypothetical protein
LTDKANKKHYHELSRYERCLADGLAGAMSNKQARTTGYPYDVKSFEQYKTIFRDLTLALYGIDGIETHLNTDKPLRQSVRNPCLAMAALDPLSLVPLPTPQSQASNQR